MSILVILGCNDERGHFDGRLGSARIGSMEFVAKNWLGPRLKFLELTGRNPRIRCDPDWGVCEEKCQHCGGVKDECDPMNCARCGTQACTGSLVCEERDEWECAGCNRREDERERAEAR